MASLLHRRFPRSVEGWLGWVIALMLVLFSLMNDQFLSIQNLLEIGRAHV